MVAQMQAPASEAVHIQRYEPVGSARELIAARDMEVIAAGPAGTGKTLAICWKVHLAMHRYPGARSLFCRESLEALKKGALTTYINGVKPEQTGVRYYGGNNAKPAAFRYPNGSAIEVMSLEDPEKVKSAEYDLIYPNEVTESPEKTWEILSSRLRNGVMPYQQIVGDCNPAGPKHWILNRQRAGKLRLISSTHRDNPAFWDRRSETWTSQGLAYVEGVLAGLSGVERERLYLGKWAAVEGLVYPEFDPDTHQKRTYVPQLMEDVDEPGTYFMVPVWGDQVDVTGWRTVLGIDIGSRNPTAILTIHIAGDERMHVSHEVYRRNMTATEIVDAIVERIDATGAEAVYIDPSAKGYIDDLSARGYPAQAAVNDVLVGIQRVHGAFQTGLTIDPNCTSLIDELGMYAYARDPKVETDKPIKDHDHALDALRYVCVSQVPPMEGQLVW